MRYLIISLVLILFLGCSLDHSNPLDSSGIEVPATVVNIELVLESQPNLHVNISWDKISNVDGYYVYKALSYNGKYNKIATVDNIEDSETIMFSDDNIQNSQSYFYKISSFTIYNEIAFEGSISGYKQIWVE